MRRRGIISICILATVHAFSAAAFATNIQIPSATPATITFTASDPDNPSVAGSSSATISFRTTGGNSTSTWRVEVQAASANFFSCPNAVPATRVIVNCANVSTTRSATGVCSGSVNLSTGFQTIASGLEDNGNVQYTIVVNFTFTDSWRFIPGGSSCSLGLNYLITAN